MSLGLSASVLVVPLLLIQNSPSKNLLNGIVNTNNPDSLTAYEVSGTTATVVIRAAQQVSTTQTVPLTTLVNDLSLKLYPQARTLAYQRISVIPADQVVTDQTATPNTLVAPAHPVLPPPPPPAVPKPAPVIIHTSAPAAVPATYSNVRVGPASWYGAPFGTCASPWLPFGTLVHITNLATGSSTTCRVEDRGPYVTGRILDMSDGTFSQIAGLGQGVVNIRMEW